ncbi:hypothetical protein DIURU_004176 [Diutina rugosa]|uniref:Ribosome biogenesis protein NSA1 n=1 Tax=Diutina rugosa TaxID=5481 RepID=A0A642UIK0_DIURU|nr:uncharacterized protein DIURU_004176 [Diutina rugosa]KAA8899693.1 hypothetical protein DIURU_004176 [Diutina rugosa]
MINDLEFNQDYTSLMVATPTGYTIYTTDPFGEYYSSFKSARRKSVVSSDSAPDDVDMDASECPTKFLKMLLSTSLTIIVPENEPRQVEIHNLKQHVKVCTLRFSEDIVGVKLNKKRLVVATTSTLSIYDLSQVKSVGTIAAKSGPYDLARDDKTLAFAVENIDKNSPIWESEFPVYHPDGKSLTPHQLRKKTGYVVLYDTIDSRPLFAFKAHDSTIGHITVYGTSSSPKLSIATASTKGTVVRVFTWESGAITSVQAFRRGHNPTAIASLVFDQEAEVLGCASENTVHLFDLLDGNQVSKPDDNEDELNDNLANLLVAKEGKKRSVMSGIMKKLPYKDFLEPKRAFAYVRLAGTHARVELGFSQQHHLYVASYDQAKLFDYKLPERGESRQECHLVLEYDL